MTKRLISILVLCAATFQLSADNRNMLTSPLQVQPLTANCNAKPLPFNFICQARVTAAPIAKSELSGYGEPTAYMILGANLNNKLMFTAKDINFWRPELLYRDTLGSEPDVTMGLNFLNGNFFGHIISVDIEPSVKKAELPTSMNLSQAIVLLRGAGYTKGFRLVNLMRPNDPQKNEPYYTFTIPHDESTVKVVFVGVNSQSVFHEFHPIP